MKVKGLRELQICNVICDWALDRGINIYIHTYVYDMNHTGYTKELINMYTVHAYVYNTKLFLESSLYIYIYIHTHTHYEAHVAV
jgi:hypothetical protein